jgi:hypothetical protein
MPDCGDNSCKYAINKTGMRTNAGCRCGECPGCGRHLDGLIKEHHHWCASKEWKPPSKETKVRYLFLCAWVQGSPSAEDNQVDTGIFSSDDLLPAFQAGEEEILSVIVEGAPNEEEAATHGYAKAFHENYTGYDTVSIVIPLTDESLLLHEVTSTVKVNLTPNF